MGTYSYSPLALSLTQIVICNCNPSCVEQIDICCYLSEIEAIKEIAVVKLLTYLPRNLYEIETIKKIFLSYDSWAQVGLSIDRFKTKPEV